MVVLFFAVFRMFSEDYCSSYYIDFLFGRLVLPHILVVLVFGCQNATLNGLVEFMVGIYHYWRQCIIEEKNMSMKLSTVW